MAKKQSSKVTRAKAGGSAKGGKAAKSKEPVKASIMDRAVQFLREVKTELKKVTWPTKRQTISSTGVVLALVFVVAAFLGLVDATLSWLIRQVIG